MTTQPDALTRPFKGDEVQQFVGKGGRTFDYVEDESVMDRLDEAFGIGGWSVEVEAVTVYEGVVKVTLRAGEAVYQDFGYPSNGTGGEALKEAVSDGIRRCGRYLGIARDLYRKHSSTSRPAGNSSPAANGGAAGRPPRPVASTVPPEPDWMDDRPQPVQNGHSVAVAGSDDRMTMRELFSAAEAQGIEKRALAAAAKELYGGNGYIKDLDDEQRAVVWAEVAR